MRDNDEFEDSLPGAKAGSEQLATLYRDIWIPILSDINTWMENTLIPEQARAQILVDIHQRWAIDTVPHDN